MTQQYTPVTWQDETTSQQGTLINAERLNQMQTAHHYADGFEEVDAVPTADPGVSYHKVVYCTADSTFYRWDGTEWTKDIDDETKALLQQEIARATEAEGELAQDLADETTRATTAETALGGRITAETSARTAADTALGGRIDAEATAREGADTTLQGHIDTLAQHTEDALDTKVDKDGAVTSVQGHTGAVLLNSAEIPLNAGASTPTVHNAILANQGQIDAVTADLADEVQARTTAVGALSTRVDTLETGLADTYNKSQVDTLLSAKADKATTLAGYGITDAYTKAEADTLLAGYVTLGTAQSITAQKKFTSTSDHAFTNIFNSTYEDVSGSYPPDTRYTGLAIQDRNNHTLVQLDSEFDSSGNSVLGLRCFKTGQSEIDLYMTNAANNTRYARLIGQRAYSAGNTTDVATIATLDAYSPMVRTTNFQTVVPKKFSGSGNTIIESVGWNGGLTFQQTVGGLDVGASNALGGAIRWYNTAGTVEVGHIVMGTDAAGNSQLIAVLKDKDGTMKYITFATSA